MPSTEPPVEIRLLGFLVVVRRDGSEVDERDWRSGKTRDLLRLLALQAGRPVLTQLLLDRLWPAAAPRQARGSLRTAASKVRTVIRDDCIERQAGSMVLVGAQVDTAALRGLLKAGREDLAEGRAELVVSRARAVERLYQGDFHADDDTSAWAVAEREDLARGRLELLAAAAECCLRLGNEREALLYANAVLFADPLREAVYRAKMRAHAELGEADRALHTFEAYRRRLAGEPSPQTHELRRQIAARA